MIWIHYNWTFPIIIDCWKSHCLNFSLVKKNKNTICLLKANGIWYHSGKIVGCPVVNLVALPQLKRWHHFFLRGNKRSQFLHWNPFLSIDWPIFGGNAFYWHIAVAKYLPPASEVWARVIFSEACGSHSVHRGSLYDVNSCLAAWFHVPSWGSPSLVPSFSQGSLSRVVSVQGGLCPGWSLSRVVSVQGGLCPGGLCSGWSLSRVVSVQGVYVQGSLPKGVSTQRGLCQRDSLDTDPHTVKNGWNAFLM